MASKVTPLLDDRNRNRDSKSRPVTPDDVAQSLRQQCAEVMRSVLLGGPMKRAKRWLGYSKKSASLYDQLHGEERTALEALCIEIDAALAEPTKPRADALAPIRYLATRYLSIDEMADEVDRMAVSDAAIQSSSASAKAARIAHEAMLDGRVDNEEMAEYRRAACRRDRHDAKEDALMHAAWRRTREDSEVAS